MLLPAHFRSGNLVGIGERREPTGFCQLKTSSQAWKQRYTKRLFEYSDLTAQWSVARDAIARLPGRCCLPWLQLKNNVTVYS